MRRISLSFALDSSARSRQLEAMVAERTKRLRDEIAVRERAEADLQIANAELRLDGLTGITNRCAFDEHLAVTWEELAVTGAELSLLFVDVHCFKLYNDEYGHLRGDLALRAVAQVLASPCRGEHELAARFAGDEFAVALPGMSAEGAAVVAERMRQLVRRPRIEHQA